MQIDQFLTQRAAGVDCICRNVQEGHLHGDEPLRAVGTVDGAPGAWGAAGLRHCRANCVNILAHLLAYKPLLVYFRSVAAKSNCTLLKEPCYKPPVGSMRGSDKNTL